MKNTPEQARLKEFMEDNFDFASLKKMGFYDKEIRRADYEAQAARVCHYFGFASVYAYCAPEITEMGDSGVAVVEFGGSVNEAGALVPGGGGWISTVQASFECPICTCQQPAKASEYWRQKCKGCKRALVLARDMSGHITVHEK